MLRRIIAIKNVGRFRNSATTPAHTLAKYVVVFAGNGYGKTTLCTIARSVQSGDAAPVIGRQTLGTIEGPDVDLLFADGNRRLKNGEWSSTFSKISVFDATFVSENVHSGDIVDIANKRNLYRVIIGRAGVDLAEQEKALTEDGRTTQADLTAAEKALRQVCPEEISLTDFINLPADPDIDSKIEIQRQVIGALQEAEAIERRPALIPLPIPPAFELNSILERSLQTLGAAAEALFSTALEFWRRYCPLEPEGFSDTDSNFDDIARSSDVLTGCLDRKARQPHVPIDGGSPLTEAQHALSRARGVFDRYNQAVQVANQTIAECKQGTAQGDLRTAQRQLIRLEAAKRRHEEDVTSACNDFVLLDEKKKLIEATKADVRNQLEAHTREVIQPYEDRINDFLDMFNADFRLVGTTHGYPGGIATSTYQLLINNRRVDLGDLRTPIDQPSFKNTLSTGDRMTLGLAIFLAQLERETDLTERIVIFDDPFSSQDAFRRSQTVYEIIRVARACAQVIVLSHDVQFLKQLWEKYPAAERSALQITLEPSGSKISVFDLDVACRGRAAAELDDLIAFRSTGAGNLREIIKKLRVVLETHFRLSYPSALSR